jgi:hypothetical protein
VIKKVYIYTLINPLNNEVFYIGYTYNLKKRLYEHLYSYNLKDNKYKKWVIEKITNAGLKPLINAIDECEYVFNQEQNMFEHERLEIYYIKKYRDEGIRLTNLTEGGKNPPLSKTKRVVYQYDKNLNFINKYESITEAAIAVGRLATSICKVLDQKKSLSCKGYYWLSTNEPNKIIIKRKVISIKKPYDVKRMIPIVQYSLDGIFLNEFLGQNDAERITGIKSKLINKCLRLNGYDQAGDYLWFYKDKIPIEIMKYDGRRFSRKILVYDLNKKYIGEYDSIRAGSKDLNIDETSICKNLKGHTSRAGNYRFVYDN